MDTDQIWLPFSITIIIGQDRRSSAKKQNILLALDRRSYNNKSWYSKIGDL